MTTTHDYRAAATSETGVIFDGAFGQTFNDGRVIELADNCGMHVSTSDVILVTHAMDGDDLTDEEWDAFHALTEYAVEFLNEHVAAEGFGFEWIDGDFHYSAYDEEV